MSGFKVGDRVVIVKSSQPDLVGLVARVTMIEPLIQDEYGLPAGVTMACTLDKWSAPHKRFLCYPHQWLEPYRDDGSEKGEWTEELRKLCNSKVSA